jgi:hypothetical protein
MRMRPPDRGDEPGIGKASWSGVATQGAGVSSGPYDVLELVLDRGLVIDAFVRVSLPVGIEFLKIDVRVVVASVDIYSRFAARPTAADLPVTVATLAMRPDIALASEPCRYSSLFTAPR